ncbi:MAG: hypothetical protein DCC75_01410 [Proteobacteria bacterium]|nr:MAG: hypothetical protein DCC75_01410 [Pseudomonadota bacterium]
MEFYEKVRPPGFWPQAASGAKGNWKQETLWIPIRSTLLCAGSMYALLIRAGRAILGRADAVSLALRSFPCIVYLVAKA